MIACNAVVKRFQEKLAVDHVSFDVAGGICCVLGPNGAGKSTLLKLMTGLLRLDEGTIRIGGLDLAKEPAEVKRRIGVLPEELGLIWSDRVKTAKTVGLFLSLSLLLFLPEDRASSSRSSCKRRLISLIFAGRNRIIMIRRELPLTVIASPVEPVA
jgi:ABC-type cobalamin/Fe3+-siderophores transport system ATPase subunit